MSKRTKEILFLFFLLALMVVIVGRSTHYSIKSYLLPVLVGIPVCILIIVQIVREFLSGKEPDAKGKASQIVNLLTDYRGNKSHNRHIHAEECEAIGLNIESLEAPGNEILQDLVLTVHHCYMHSLMNTGTYKVVENHMGTAFMKQIAIQQFVIPQQPQHIP